MERELTEKLVHKVSNLLAAIYTFGEPALDSGQGMAEALREILAVGQEVEECLGEAKRMLRKEPGRPEE